MASDSDRAEAVERAERRLRVSIREALRQARDLDRRIYAIRRDPTIPEETREAVVREERAARAERIRGSIAAARKEHERAQRRIARWHRSFEVSPEAAATVRRLVEAGVRPSEIVGQAAESGDRAVVEAVIREAPYLRAADGKLGSADAPSIIEEAEQALAGMSRSERATVEAARALRSSRTERLEAVSNFGEAVLLGDPNRHASARLALGLTEEPGDRTSRGHTGEIPARALRGADA